MPSPLTDRIPTKRIAIFALRIASVWLAFALAWPLLAPMYRPFYCAVGNLVFDNGKASAEFSVAEDVKGDHDIDIRLEKRGSGVWGEAGHSSRLSGYLPTITLITFILATPISWERKRRALLWGLLFVTLYVLLRMWIPIRRDFSNPDALQVYAPGALGRQLIGISERSLVNAPASWFIVPIFIWVGVAFRRTDWELLQDGEGDPRG